MGGDPEDPGQAAAVACSGLVWAAGSGQDMPCSSARGRPGGPGSGPAPASAQAPLMEPRPCRPYGTVSRSGRAPGSLPLDIEQDRSRPVPSPHAHRLCRLFRDGHRVTHLHQRFLHTKENISTQTLRFDLHLFPTI